MENNEYFNMKLDEKLDYIKINIKILLEKVEKEKFYLFIKFCEELVDSFDTKNSLNKIIDNLNLFEKISTIETILKLFNDHNLFTIYINELVDDTLNIIKVINKKETEIFTKRRDSIQKRNIKN